MSGIQQAKSDMVLAAEPATLFAPEARKGRLYIVTETSHEVARSLDACNLVLRTIRKVFYDDRSYSVTSSLRKAISTANNALYQQNFSIAAQKRAYVGASCIVVKDDDVYIAQVLPAQVYLLSNGKLRALPPNPAWTGGSEGTTALLTPNALGSSLSIEPEFYRATVRPGDTIIACSTNLARILGQDEVLGLLRAPDAAEIVAQLQEVGQRNALAEAHGLAICVRPRLSAAAQAAPLSRSGVGERGRLLARDVSSWLGRVTSEATLLVRPDLREQQRKADSRQSHAEREQAQLSQVPDEPPPIPMPRPQPLDLGEGLDERLERERQNTRPLLGRPQPRVVDEELPPSAFLGEGDYIAPPAPASQRRIDLSDTPGMGAARQSSSPYAPNDLPIDPSIKDQLMRPFEQIGARMTSYTRRRRLRRPPPSAMPAMRRRGGLSYRREGPPFPWLLLLLLVLSVALLIVYGKGLMDRQARAEASKLLQQAEVAVAQVRTAPDDATAQQRLDSAAEALALVRASDAITGTRENQQRFVALERQYERAQAAVQKISYLDDITELAQHPQVAAGATFSSIVVSPPPQGITNTVGFDSIYALDANQGVLYRIPKIGGAPEPFLRPDMSVLNGLPVGQVKAIAWRIDNIVAVAQSEGGPFIYYFREGDQWRGSNLGGSEEWRRSDSNRLRLATYEGNLYFLNAVPEQVLKYISGRPGDIYDPWIKEFGASRTENASDLAVDGKVYLLQPDGRIQVFAVNAFEREIEPPALKPPVTVTTNFFVTGASPEQGSIFLIETQQERIVQIDKQTGVLIQQIRVRADNPIQLNELTALFVDESGPQATLYIANGGRILKAALPAPPQSLRAADEPPQSDQPTPGP